MHYGVIITNVIFQRGIENILTCDVKKLIIYQDDKDICVLICDTMTYLGYHISNDRILPDTNLINKI